LAAALERDGFETDILDASVGTRDDRLEDTFWRPERQSNGLIRFGMSFERIAEVVARGDYQVVGIHSNFTPQTSVALRVAKLVKDVSRDILVLAGGVSARSLVARFLQSGNVDAVCLTEGEQILVHIVRAHSRGKGMSSISGIARMHEGAVVRQPVLPTDVYRDLDLLPTPAWGKAPFFHYDRISSPRGVLEGERRYMSFETSRGCPFHCTYCHISREKESPDDSGDIGSLRFKSVPRVVEELQILKGLGVTQVSIEDDSLLARKERVRTILSQIRGLGLELSDINGVNLVHFLKKEGGELVIDREYPELLRDAGFKEIVCPIESASQRVLDKYASGKLNHQTLDVVELIRVMSRAGIVCLTNMMIGFPDETEAEMHASIELGKRLVEEGGRRTSPSSSPSRFPDACSMTTRSEMGTWNRTSIPTP
jgi:radical SAM superfamily enzyme YgiQ (UPF0313 family)